MALLIIFAVSVSFLVGYLRGGVVHSFFVKKNLGYHIVEGTFEVRVLNEGRLSVQVETCLFVPGTLLVWKRSVKNEFTASEAADLAAQIRAEMTPRQG